MTFALRFKVWVGTGRAGGIPGSKNKLQRSPLRQGKKNVTTGQGTKKSIWQEQVTKEEKTHHSGEKAGAVST